MFQLIRPIAITAATFPSLEDLIGGAIPGIPRIRLHNPVLARENGNDFLARFRSAAEGALDPFVLVVEGSIPDETNKADGCWAGFGTDPATGQPIPTCDWIDRLAPRAWAAIAIGTCATYGGIHGIEGNPTGAMGLADYLGWEWKSGAGIPVVPSMVMARIVAPEGAILDERMMGPAAENEASLRLHASFGFVKVAHFRQVGFKFNRWLDVVYMELLL